MGSTTYRFLRINLISGDRILKIPIIHRSASMTTVHSFKFQNKNKFANLVPLTNYIFSGLPLHYLPLNSRFILKRCTIAKFSTVCTQDPSKTIMARGPDGTLYAIPPKPLGQHLTKYLPKLKPSIIKSRIMNLRSTSLQKKKIRHSPWRLNLICQFVAGQTVWKP